VCFHSRLLLWVHITLLSIVLLTGFLDELDVLLRTGTLFVLFIVLTSAFLTLSPLGQKLAVLLVENIRFVICTIHHKIRPVTLYTIAELFPRELRNYNGIETAQLVVSRTPLTCTACPKWCPQY